MLKPINSSAKSGGVIEPLYCTSCDPDDVCTFCDKDDWCNTCDSEFCNPFASHDAD